VRSERERGGVQLSADQERGGGRGRLTGLGARWLGPSWGVGLPAALGRRGQQGEGKKELGRGRPESGGEVLICLFFFFFYFQTFLKLI